MTSHPFATFRIHGSDQSRTIGVKTVEEVLGVALVWLERHSQRRQLARLPEHLLRDMGIDRGEAMIEVEKPFWKA